MRLWSIHPKYLDSKGLTAVWREALLAKKVLEGKTSAYRSHPQIRRFRGLSIKFINTYLYHIRNESCRRGYCFDKSKIGNTGKGKIKVTEAQIEYEFEHLKRKLRKRDKAGYKQLLKVRKIQQNPLFSVVKGKIESWEKI